MFLLFGNTQNNSSFSFIFIFVASKMDLVVHLDLQLGNVSAFIMENLYNRGRVLDIKSYS